jgi:trans-aconitate 2-methyltransferase
LGDSAQVLHANLTEPISIEPVDVVFSNAVFHWISDHELLFSNLARVLRTGGQLVAQWGGAGNIARLLASTGDLERPSPPNFATAEETAARLEAAAFTDVNVWLHDDPADFDTREDFEVYLRTVCLRCHLDLVPAAERDDLIRAVADRLPDRRIDYVRLNAVARRA